MYTCFYNRVHNKTETLTEKWQLPNFWTRPTAYWKYKYSGPTVIQAWVIQIPMWSAHFWANNSPLFPTGIIITIYDDDGNNNNNNNIILLGTVTHTDLGM